MGALEFDVLLNNIQYRKALQESLRDTIGFSNKTVSEAARIDTTFKRLGQAAAGYFAFTQLADLPQQIIKVRGEFQQLEIAFGTMLRSKTAADALLKEIVQTAATTPFSLKDVGQGAKQLLAYGSTAKSVIGEIRTLGDVAAGVSAPINDLIYLYGTLRTQGRAYAVDIRQFASRGIPIYAELAKVLDVNVDKVNDLVSSGKVGFKEVEQAFKNMTTEGGQFSGLMEAQSKSLTGLQERLSDAYDQMLNKVGQANEGILASVLIGATGVVENYESILNVLGVLAATYGTYKAALLSVAVAHRIINTSATATLFLEMARALGPLTTLTYAQAVAIGVQTKAQAALNAVMAINPYVAAATAIAALSAAVYVLNDSTTAAEQAQKNLNDATEKATQSRSELESKTSQLIEVIKSETSTRFAQIQAFEALQKLYPAFLRNMSLQEFQALKTADAQRQLNAALDQMNIGGSQKQYNDAQRRVKDYQKQLDALLKQQAASGAGGAGLLVPIEQLRRKVEVARLEAEKYGQVVKDNEKAALEANETEDEKRKRLEAQLDTLKTQRESIEQSITKTQKLGEAAQSIRPFFEQLSLGVLNDQIDTLTKKINNLPPAPNANDIRHRNFESQLGKAETANDLVALGGLARTEQEIDALTARIKEAKSTLVKESRDYKRLQQTLDILNPKKPRAVPEKDKPQPFGSIAYYEQVARKADEILQKTPSSNTAEIQKQEYIKLEAQKRADEIRKQTAVKTYAEELDEKRKQYEQYQRYIDFVGQAQADAQFAQLKESGSNYYEYITSEIKRLEAVRDSKGLFKEEGNSLAILKTDRDTLTGQKTQIDVFRDKLQQAADEAESLTDYMRRLDELGATVQSNTTAFGFEAKREYAEKKLEAERQQKELLRNLLENIIGSEEQRLAIAKKYKDERDALENSSLKKDSPAYKAAQKDIEGRQKEEVRGYKEALLAKSDEFKKFNDLIGVTRLKDIKEQIKVTDALIAKAEKDQDTETEIYKNALKKRKELKEQYDKTSLDIIAQFAQIGGQLGEILSQSNGALGQMGGLIAGIASQAGNMLTAFDKSLDPIERQKAALGGVLSLVDIIISSANQRKQAEADYYRSTLDFQQQYNLLLNEQLGLQSQNDSNLFINDYEGKRADALAKLTDAQDKYNESLDKLAGGKAKNGQKNGIDLKAVGQGATSGAAVGALAGGPVGAAVGAVVGGLVGLFAGKKKKDTFVGLLDEYKDLIKTAADGTQTLNEELAKSLIATNQVDDATKQLIEDTLDWQKAVEEAKQAINDIIKELAGAVGDNVRNNIVKSFEDGTDAAIAFGDAVGGVIEDILTKTLFNEIFADDFKKLTEKAKASLGENGDGNLVDDLVSFAKDGVAKAQQYSDALKQAQQELAAQGVDIFQGAGGTKSDPNSSVGAVKAITEETGGLLVGQSNAQRIILADIRVSQIDILAQVRQQTLYQSEIASNTRYNRHLETIERHLRDIKEADGLRSTGGFGPK